MNSPGSPPAEECYYDRPSAAAAAAAASSWRRLNNTDDSIRRRRASKDGLVSGGGDDERAFRNLLEIDDQDLSASSYFSFQTDLRPYMRKMVVIWMLEVCEDQSIEDETFWIAVNYFDRILSVLPIRKSQLQLVASACLFIASKLNNNEGASPSTFIKASRLVTYTDFSITVDELLEWELTTLQALKWNVLVATPYDFLRRFVVCLPLADDDDDDSDRRRSVERHATTLIALSATDVKFVVYPASMLASGCLCAAAKELFGIDWVTGVRLYQRLQQYTSVETDCLVTCQEQIEDLVKLSLEEAAAADARQQQQEEDEETEEETEEEEEENSSSSSLTRSAIKQSSSSKASMAPTTPTDVREISVNCGGGGGAGFERHK